jgi:hypothetical protein
MDIESAYPQCFMPRRSQRLVRSHAFQSARQTTPINAPNMAPITPATGVAATLRVCGGL